MGDRANIVIDSEDGKQIYLYTHWRGSALPHILRDALVRGKGRWNDEPYLTRIIFCEMVKLGLDDTTGFGISTYPSDNEHAYLRVDARHQSVSIDWNPVRKYHDLENKFISFSDFSTMNDVSWDALAKISGAAP